jgi:hypothetical protein
MDYLNHLAVEYENLLNAIASIFGILGVVFGAWRYLRERQAREALEAREGELDKALSRLRHLERFASDLKQYSKAT